MSRFKCIIFDCDGVLVDSEATTMQVLVDMAKDVGVEITLAEATKAFSGYYLSYCFDYINKRSATRLPENAIELFRKRTYAAFRTNIQPVPGIHALMQGLDRPRCVASNGPLEKIELNLRLIDLIDYFDGNLFSAYQIQQWKPKPDLFLHAAEQMGFAPKDCAVIEDSVAGVQAAVAGGFEVFGYAKEHSAEDLKDAGAHVFYAMNALNDLL